MSKCVFCFIYYNCIIILLSVTVSVCHDKGNVFLYNKFTSICILETNKKRWTDKVRHLGNFIDTTCTDYIDCLTKKSYVIGCVNKLKVNFGKMTHNVLINLFKS